MKYSEGLKIVMGQRKFALYKYIYIYVCVVVRCCVTWIRY